MSARTAPPATGSATTQEAELNLPGARRGPSARRTAYGALGLVLALVLWELASFLKGDPVILPTVQETAI